MAVAPLGLSQVGAAEMMLPPATGRARNPTTNANFNHRKDLLWKPLLRMFRRFLKKDALSLDSYQTIRDESFTRQGYLFCKALGVSDLLAGQVRNQCAVLLMISSHRIIWRKQLIPICQEMMAPYLTDIWPLFFRSFNETSHRQRLAFFSEPIIHALWDRFRAEKAAEITEYLERVFREETNNFCLNRNFQQDICLIEISSNCRILPDFKRA